MRPLLLGVAVLALVSLTSSALIVDACGQEAGPPPKPAAKQAAKTTVSFSEDVFPIFKGRCLGCHEPGGAGYEKSGFNLGTYEGLMKGTKFGPMVIAGDPGSSNLMVLLDWRASAELRMPHGTKKLSTCDRDAIRRWIMEGARNN
jgi:hypothetical protein